MNDLISVIRPIVSIVVITVIYVFITQLVNDVTCISLSRPNSPIFGKEILEFVSLCWWN